jgi:hypothetical protein
MRHVTHVVLILATLSAIVLAGCGESAEKKATKKVCSARDDIATQVETLKGMTVSTATTDQISSSLKAIRQDLSDIAGAQGDLNDQRKAQVKSANEQFAASVKTVLSDVGKSLSVSAAKDQLTTALQQLGATYQKTFAKVDCSGT